MDYFGFGEQKSLRRSDCSFVRSSHVRGHFRLHSDCGGSFVQGCGTGRCFEFYDGGNDFEPSEPCDAVEGCKAETSCNFYGDLRCGDYCGGVFV